MHYFLAKKLWLLKLLWKKIANFKQFFYEKNLLEKNAATNEAAHASEAQ
jgi:hypothetical protein